MGKRELFWSSNWNTGEQLWIFEEGGQLYAHSSGLPKAQVIDDFIQYYGAIYGECDNLQSMKWVREKYEEGFFDVNK